VKTLQNMFALCMGGIAAALTFVFGLVFGWYAIKYIAIYGFKLSLIIPEWIKWVLVKFDWNEMIIAFMGAVGCCFGLSFTTLAIIGIGYVVFIISFLIPLDVMMGVARFFKFKLGE
jgi:hypothetical protein